MNVISRPPLTFWALIIHAILILYLIAKSGKDLKKEIRKPNTTDISNILSESINSGSLFLLGAVVLDFLLYRILFTNADGVEKLRHFFFPTALVLTGLSLVFLGVRLCWAKFTSKNWPRAIFLLMVSEFLAFLGILTCALVL